MTNALRIAAVTPLSTVDYPGRLAAVVFLQGCAWRCSYCHNAHLQDATGPATLAWPQVRGFLERRRGLLDAVVFSGGEPTQQAASLADAAREVRALGFLAGLHTAGLYPDLLAGLLPLFDWVGLDVKATQADYAGITGVRGSGDRARESLAHVLRSGVAHECRTTWHEALYPADRLAALGHDLADAGVRHWVVQTCRDGHRALGAPPGEALQGLQHRFEHFELR
jgi:pyruvate formate lyase activating enzyme